MFNDDVRLFFSLAYSDFYKYMVSVLFTLQYVYCIRFYLYYTQFSIISEGHPTTHFSKSRKITVKHLNNAEHKEK